MDFAWRCVLLLSLIPAFAVSLSAQTAAATQANASAPPNSQVSGAPAKKVWTNEDFTGVQTEEVTVSGDTRRASSPSTHTAAQNVNRSAAWYRGRISQLQAKLPPLDAQIADLQAAFDGRPTGDAKKSSRPYSVRMDSWPSELDRLDKQRGDILGKIADLRDEARRRGIPANALP
jgi:hypothetical protein